MTQWPDYSQFWAQLLREDGAAAARAEHGSHSLTRQGEETVVDVGELLEDAGTFKNNAFGRVGYCFFAPAKNALGSALQALGRHQLAQTGPGHYRTRFRPSNPGVYLVRVRHGAQMVSAGDVFNPSAEAATGQVNTPLLKKSAELTGGSFVDVEAPRRVPLRGAEISNYVELWPWIIGPFPPALPRRHPHPPLGNMSAAWPN